jgi:hypothetical protein
MTVRVKGQKNGRLVRFWNRTDRSCEFSRSICDKNCHIITCIESDSFWGYVGTHESWEDNISNEEEWAKINIDRRRSSCIEDSFEKSHDYCSTGDSRTDCSSWGPCFHESCPTWASQIQYKSTAGLQLLNLWLLKVMLRCVNDGVTAMKPGYQTTENACVIWSGESTFTLSLNQGEFTFREHSRKPKIRNAWFQQWNTGEVLLWFGEQYRGILFGWYHYDPSWPNYWKGVLERLGNFPTTMQFSKRRVPHSHSWNCSVKVWRAWRFTSASQSPDLNTIEPLCLVLKTRMRNTVPPPTFLEHLEDVLQEEWCKIFPRDCSKLVHWSVALQTFVGPWPLLHFHNLCYTDGRTPRTSDQPVARPLPTHTQQHKHRINAHTDIHALSGIQTPWPQRPSERRQFMP